MLKFSFTESARELCPKECAQNRLSDLHPHFKADLNVELPKLIASPLTTNKVMARNYLV